MQTDPWGRKVCYSRRDCVKRQIQDSKMDDNQFYSKVSRPLFIHAIKCCFGNMQRGDGDMKLALGFIPRKDELVGLI
jgi:hypothetical protein